MNTAPRVHGVNVPDGLAATALLRNDQIESPAPRRSDGEPSVARLHDNFVRVDAILDAYLAVAAIRVAVDT